MRSVRLRRLVLPSTALLLAMPADALSQNSRAMQFECRAARADTPASRQQAERWVRDRLAAFVPTPDQALRMRSLQLQAEQVKLAFHGISSTCAQYLAGTMPRQDADRSLSGFEQTIANFLHDVGNEAVVKAAGGQVADIPAIRQTLTEVGAAGRQAALLGDEALAEQARAKLVDALTTFSRAFAEACFGQTFDPRVALGIARQNDKLGTGIDVTHCANREYTAEGKGADILWTFAHCGIGAGNWSIRTEGPLHGRGTGTVEPDLSGTWSVTEDTPERDINVQYAGTLRISVKPVPGEKDLVVPDQLSLQATHGIVTTPEGVTRRELSLSGLTFAVKRSDQPCRVTE